MDSTATIVTSRKEIVDAIRACVPNKVIEINPCFIDLKEPGFNANFEPQFQTVEYEVENTVRNLRGKVICAIPPGLSHGNLLLHLAHTFKDRVLLHASLHELNSEGISQALENSEEINPWFLTSVAARRAAESLLGACLIPKLSEAGLPYPGWQSLFYLQLVRDIALPCWERHLHFGSCVAVEIDSFGGTIHHRGFPMRLDGAFEVIQKEVLAQWPDPHLIANQLLRHAGQDLEECWRELEQAYYSGTCSWPFPYGGVSYGERPVQVRSQPAGLLRHLAKPKPARKVIRIYRQNRVLFRSLSYYCDGQPPLNPLPTKAQVKVAIEPQIPSTTLAAFLDHLDGYQLNLDFPAFLKLVRGDYVQTTNGNLTITPKGQALLQQTDRVGLTSQCLYLILRLLENIQTDEASYADVLGLIQRNLHAKARLKDKRQQGSGLKMG